MMATQNNGANGDANKTESGLYIKPVGYVFEQKSPCRARMIYEGGQNTHRQRTDDNGVPEWQLTCSLYDETDESDLGQDVNILLHGNENPLPGVPLRHTRVEFDGGLKVRFYAIGKDTKGYILTADGVRLVTKKASA